VTIGGTLLDPTADINTTYTNGLYPQLGAGNTYTAGSKQSFNPSATTAGARIVPGAWFSAPIAGDQGVNAAGDFGTNDGVNNRFYFYINAADPNAPGLPTGTDLLLRPCEIVIGSLGTGSTALATDNTPVSLCDSPFTGSLKITEVKCYADSSTGAPAVEPKITGGAATSILTGPIACGNGAFGSAGTLNGSPVQTTDQSIDGVITTAGGTAKYIIIRIKRSL
jgi:hypothetical protein